MSYEIGSITNSGHLKILTNEKWFCVEHYSNEKVFCFSIHFLKLGLTVIYRKKLNA